MHIENANSMLTIDRHIPAGFNALCCSATSDGRLSKVQEKKKVIIVDDERLIAESLADILNGEGFDVTAVFSGHEAIEIARRVQPDVLLSDVVMPGINGIDVAKSVREFFPQCRIILFSGQALTGDLLAEARVQGHNFEMLAKPVSPYSLIMTLRSKSEQ